MKNKILALLLLLLFAAPCLVPAQASADTPAADTVYLIQPVDIFVDGGTIYAVDIIDDGKNTVIHQISADLTERKTYYLNGVTKKIYVDGVNLYAMQKDKILSLGIDRSSEVLAPGGTIDAAGIIDFTLSGGMIYFLTDKKLVEYNRETQTSKPINTTLTETKSVSSANGKVCFIYGETFMTYSDEEGFSDPETLANGADRVLGAGEEYVFFNSEKFVKRDGTALLSPGEGVTDAFFHNNYLLVLGGDKKISQYLYRDGAFEKVDGFGIGNDKVDREVPAAFDGFSFAHAEKYPTNILYEASKSLKPAPYKLLSAGDSFLILHYDGAESSPYHYVFYKGGFGWLEKGPKTGSVGYPNDENLALIGTEYKFIGQAVATAYIYSLPYYDDAGTFVVENVPKDTVINISDRYEGLTESNADWFYVSYEKDGKTKEGFVRQTLITNITVSPQTEVRRFTVNTDLNSRLGLFKDASLQTPMNDAGGNPILLSSGKQVSIISIDQNNVALAQVSVGGEKYIGYLDAEYLIEDGLTNYLALGLVLGILLVLGTVFFVIMAKRRKKHSVPPEDDPDPFQAEKTADK